MASSTALYSRFCGFGAIVSWYLSQVLSRIFCCLETLALSFGLQVSGSQEPQRRGSVERAEMDKCSLDVQEMPQETGYLSAVEQQGVFQV
jgi:hypothetical protein